MNKNLKRTGWKPTIRSLEGLLRVSKSTRKGEIALIVDSNVLPLIRSAIELNKARSNNTTNAY